jgi:Chlorophyll A-B binding protein
VNLDNSLHCFGNVVTLVNVITPYKITKMANTPLQEPLETENRNAWVFGFTPQAEIWNGRLAMIGFITVFLTETFSSGRILQLWGLL